MKATVDRATQRCGTFKSQAQNCPEPYMAIDRAESEDLVS
jgi:hypothetical protein